MKKEYDGSNVTKDFISILHLDAKEVIQNFSSKSFFRKTIEKLEYFIPKKLICV